MARKPAQSRPYDDYLNERVDYGGERMSRAAMIRELQAVAAMWADDPTERQLLVGRYLQGYEQYTEQCP